MSVYNGLPWLTDAVESVLSQSFSDFEFIIVDDGSTDGSLEVIQAFVERDARIRLVSRPNKGLIFSLNEAASLARAPLLARMDADDVCHPTRFERQVQAFNSRPGLIALGTSVRCIKANGEQIDTQGKPPIGEEAMRAAFDEGTGFIGHPTLMMRREAFEATGGYRAAYLHAEDLDLLYRLSFIGTLDNLPEALLDYRIHDRNVSVLHALSMQMMGSLINLLARIRANEGIDLSGLATEPATLETIDSVYRRPGLARQVAVRMMHERYVGWPVALQGEALEHIISTLSSMRHSGIPEQRRRAMSLGWRSIKGLIRLRAWRGLVRFVFRVYL
jgi:glycosyltransferase involved in cell wall biosynthesis